MSAPGPETAEGLADPGEPLRRPLRETLARHGLQADKRLGQHFLLDGNLTRKIAALAGPLPGFAVLEVGPGPGGLTRALIEGGAAKILAVEKDARFLPVLAELAAAADGRLLVEAGDALKIDEAGLLERAAPGLPVKVVANLPYNVATPLLVRWLTGDFRPAALVLMFQLEVAQRIVASPGEAAYGRLAVLCQTLATARIALTLPARAFTPPPKVDSAVVVLAPRADRPEASRVARLEQVTRAAFGQRRKMLRSSLKALGGEALLARAGVRPEARAEELDVRTFLRLAEALEAPRARD